jgi:protein-tyrosine phosphatase
VIAYLLSRASVKSYDEALNLVRSKRNVVSLNPGFERQLRAYAEAGFDVHRAHNALSRAKVSLEYECELSIATNLYV